MKQIIQTTVASGVIGQYDHDWSIIKLRDIKYSSESYELFIRGDHVASVASIVEALAILVEEFSE